MSASMVTTCRRCAIGAGIYEFDLSTRCEMTDAEPELTILALNSGSSSLKFGLYRVGSAPIEVLLSGEAESIGDRKVNSLRRIRVTKCCSPKPCPFPANGKRSFVSEDSLPTPTCRRRSRSGIESCTADRDSDDIASLMMRFYGSLKRRGRSRRCIFHRLFRSSASRENIFLWRYRLRASTPPFTPNWRRSRGSFRFPRNCNRRGSNATGFMVYRVNRLCANLRTISQID
jgi:hypothetical protein